jgi:two-component sensor histidine kinase
VHHRVKNNLAAIVGLLDMQRQAISDSDATEALKELGSRIKSMALVHERLYRSENLAVIDMEDYLKSLISHLRVSFGIHTAIRWKVQAKNVEMSLDAAVPCGMIVNELVSNALKHAFPGGNPRPGQATADVLVSLRQEGAAYTLTVADNGVEIPATFDWETTKSLGLRLVRMLGTHQLGGELRLDRDNGTSFTLTFSHKR